MNPNTLLFVLGLTGFAANIAVRVLDPIVPLLAREFNVSVTVVALLASAYTLPYALGQPILGPLGDSKGKVRVMSIALLVLAAALAGSMLAWDVPTLAIARALSGLAAGACIPLAIAIVGDRFPLEQRQVALSRYLLAVIVGQLAGAPMSGILSEMIGWRPVFGIAAAIALIAAIAVRTMLPPREDAERPPFNTAMIIATYKRILRHPLAKYCYLTVAVEGVFIYGIPPYIAALLEERGAGGVREAGFVVAGIGLGGLIFNLVLPGLLRRTSRASVMRLGGCVIAAGMVVVALGATWPIEMAGFTAIGLGFYMLHTGIQIEATELAPDARGSAVALHAFSLFFGMALGPLFYGLAIPRIGASTAIIIGGLFVMAAAFLMASQVARRRAP